MSNMCKKFYLVKYFGRYTVYDNFGEKLCGGLQYNEALDYAKSKNAKPIRCCYLYMVFHSTGVIK